MQKIIILFSIAFVCVLAQGKPKSDRGPPPPPEGGPPKRNGGPGPGGHNPWANYTGCNMSTYPGKVNSSFCCPSIPRISRRSNNYTDDCKKECSKSNDRAKDFCCIAQCKLKQSGVVKADGTYDGQAAAAKYTAASAKPDVWQPIVQKAVDKCIAEASKLVEEWAKVMNRSVKCESAASMAIEHCVRRELFINCPEAEQTKSENCTKLNEFAKSCIGYPFFEHGGHCHGKGKGENKHDGKGKGDEKNEGKQEGKGKGDGKGKGEGKKSTDAPAEGGNVQKGKQKQKEEPKGKPTTTKPTVKSG